jgi:uncharacterized protein involved in outer membrane biogenesis
MKKFLIILAIVVVLLGVGVAILLANLDKIVESKKDYILEKAETAVGREITIEDIGVTLSRGIGVKLSNVTLADDPDFRTGHFVTAKDLTVRVKLLPLIRKQIEVKRLVVNEPVVHVILGENGLFNYSSMIQKAGPGGEDSAPAGASKNQPGAAALVLAFADIKNGSVRFEDRKTGMDLNVSRIDATAKNAGLGQVASIKIAAALQGDKQNIKLEGEIGPVERYDSPEHLRPVPVDLKAEIGPFDYGQIRALIPENPDLYQLDYLEPGGFHAVFNIVGQLGALELSESTIKMSLLGAESENIIIKVSAGPVDVLSKTGQTPDAEFAADIAVGPIPLAKLREKAGSAGVVPPELQLDGEASAAAKISGSLKSARAEITVDLTGSTILRPEKFNKPAGIPLTVSSNLTVSEKTAGIEKATVKFHELELETTGTIDLSGENPVVDLAVKSNKADLSKFADILPAIQPFSVGGTIRLLADIKGALAPGKQPDVNGTLELSDGSARIEQMPQPVTGGSARMVFTQDNARLENTSALVGQSRVNLGAEVTRFQPFEASYTVTAPEAHRTDFQTPPKPSPRPEIMRDVKIEGQLRQDGEVIYHTGKATSPSGSLANVDYRNMSASLRSTQDEVKIETFSAEALGGTVEGNGVFHPTAEPPAFEMTTRVRRVNLAEYFKYKVKSLPKFIEGSIDLDLDVNGAGKEWEQISPSLSGGGAGAVLQGSLLNVNVANELLYGLQQLPMVDQNAINNMRNKNPKLFSSNNTVFKDLRGDIRIENGRVHSKGLIMKTEEFSIAGDGWVSFDQQMNLNAKILLSPQTTQKWVNDVNVLKYLTNDRGQLEIPISLSGGLVKPQLLVDYNALSKKIQSSMVDAGVDALKGEVEDQVKDFLKGFGKKKSTAKPDTSQTP